MKFGLTRRFGIEIGFEILGAQCGFNTVGWDLSFRGPEDGVEDEFALAVIAPPSVEMASGEAETASPILALGCPGDMLWFFGGDSFADGWVATVFAIGSAHGAVRRNIREHWGNAFHIWTEAHVEIPFVVAGEWFYAIADRMLREFLEVGIPVGIDAPVDLETAADPVDKLLVAFFNGGFNCIVNEHQTGAAIHDFLQLFEPVFLQGGVTGTSIGINDDTIGFIECFGRRPFAVEVNFGDYWSFCVSQTFGEELNPRVMFVLSRAVRRFSGD